MAVPTAGTADWAQLERDLAGALGADHVTSRALDRHAFAHDGRRGVTGRIPAQVGVLVVQLQHLGRPDGETFGGNYGEPSPGLPYTFEEESGATVSIPPVSWITKPMSCSIPDAASS